MVQAYILIEMAAGHSRNLVNALTGLEGVRDAARVTGPYDVIAVLEAADINTISDRVTQEVHSFPGVMRTTTCFCIG